MLIRPLLINYNGDADTIECLHSLRAQNGVECVPLVVDNASRAGSVERIRQAHPDVEVLQSERNRGFCGGNNIGIRHALHSGCDYLFLVNNDTSMEPDCLKLLLECAQAKPDAGVVSPAMWWYSERDKPWFTGSALQLDKGILHNGGVDLRAAKIREPFEIPWTTGCAMLIPAAVMRRIGGFEERFFAYLEDADWSLRARQAGQKCYLCPSANLYHKVSATSGQGSPHKTYYSTRNKLLFFARNAPLRQRPEALARVTGRSLRSIRASLGPNRLLARSEWLGLVDFYTRRFGPCRHSW